MSEANWRDPSELGNALEWKWSVENGSQSSAIIMHVDLRRPTLTADEIYNGMLNMWSVVWAPLVTSSTVCVRFDSSPLLSSSGGIGWVPPLLTGNWGGASAGRGSSVVISAWVGGRDARANRRTYVPFIPRSWASSGFLTNAGHHVFATRLRGLMLGMDGADGGFGMVPIIYQKAVPSNRFHPARPARWAVVRQMIVNSYLDRAPGSG